MRFAWFCSIFLWVHNTNGEENGCTTQLAKKILPAETFPKVFPGLNDPQTYVDFILAVGKFSVCTNLRKCRKEPEMQKARSMRSALLLFFH